jgi:hypothetical protein
VRRPKFGELTWFVRDFPSFRTLRRVMVASVPIPIYSFLPVGRRPNWNISQYVIHEKHHLDCTPGS